MGKTKIICTLGPAVDDEGILRRLIINGMDVARFNFSHGTHDEHKVRMDRLKRLRDEMGKPVAILLDTKGPEIRLKKFENGEVSLVEGQKFSLIGDSDLPGNENQVGITYFDLPRHLSKGDKILVDDGKVELEVCNILHGSIECVAKNSGVLKDKKSMNIPGVSIPMDYIREIDREDILFGISQNIDYVAASFVRTGRDVEDLRTLLDSNGGERIKIISKIENIQGLNNLDEIIRLSDGVMVARGDLGVEIPFRDVPALQKKIIRHCLRQGKIVVTATQMLESMTFSPRPTRAEVSDIANAVYDGTTSIMLSGESASGKYPAEAVRTMAEVAEATENSIDYGKDMKKNFRIMDQSIKETICKVACDAAEYVGAKAIVTVTRSGLTAFLISGFRPSCTVIAAVVDERGMRQLSLAWGVHPVKANEQETVDKLFEHAKEEALKTDHVEVGDTIVIVSGSGTTSGNVSDTIRICKL